MGRRGWTAGYWTGAETEREAAVQLWGVRGCPSSLDSRVWAQRNCPTVDPRPDGCWCQHSLEAKAVSSGHLRLTYKMELVGSSSGVWLPARREGAPDGGRGSVVSWLGFFALSNLEKAGHAKAEISGLRLHSASKWWERS